MCGTINQLGKVNTITSSDNKSQIVTKDKENSDLGSAFVKGISIYVTAKFVLPIVLGGTFLTAMALSGSSNSRRY